MTTTPSDATTIDTTPSTGIIDFRARPNTYEYMADLLVPIYPLWTQFRTDPPPVKSLDTFIQALRANGIDRAFFTGRQRIENGRLTFGVPNDYVAQCVAAHPDVLIGVASVDPSTGVDEVAQELDHSIGERGLKGIALDFHWMKVPVSDPVFTPVYAYAQKKGVPVILTIGGLNGLFGHPDRSQRSPRHSPISRSLLRTGCVPTSTSTCDWRGATRTSSSRRRCSGSTPVSSRSSRRQAT